MSDIFNWLSGLDPGPWSLLLAALVGLVLLTAWMTHLYCRYREYSKRLEAQRLSQLQAWQQARESQDALQKGLIDLLHVGLSIAEDRKSSEDQDSDDDSDTPK